MTRTAERLIDLGALMLLLGFCWMTREDQPALAGMVVAAAIQFWLSKNASSPDSPAHQQAAAEALRAAELTAAAAAAAAAVLKAAERVREGEVDRA